MHERLRPHNWITAAFRLALPAASRMRASLASSGLEHYPTGTAGDPPEHPNTRWTPCSPLPPAPAGAAAHTAPHAALPRATTAGAPQGKRRRGGRAPALYARCGVGTRLALPPARRPRGGDAAPSWRGSALCSRGRGGRVGRRGRPALPPPRARCGAPREGRAGIAARLWGAGMLVRFCITGFRCKTRSGSK